MTTPSPGILQPTPTTATADSVEDTSSERTPSLTRLSNLSIRAPAGYEQFIVLASHEVRHWGQGVVSCVEQVHSIFYILQDYSRLTLVES